MNQNEHAPEQAAEQKPEKKSHPLRNLLFFVLALCLGAGHSLTYTVNAVVVCKGKCAESLVFRVAHKLRWCHCAVGAG